MEKMPDFKQGFITLWRKGQWVQVPLTDMPKIIEEDNRGTQDSPDMPTGA